VCGDCEEYVALLKVLWWMEGRKGHLQSLTWTSDGCDGIDTGNVEQTHGIPDLSFTIHQPPVGVKHIKSFRIPSAERQLYY